MTLVREKAMISANRPLLYSLAVIGLIVAGCGGTDESENAAGDSSRQPNDTPQPANTVAADAPTGAIDSALAAEGQQLFTSRGCTGCHRVGGGRFTGPDLLGVDERRDYGWVVAMITNPDSMIRNDETARALFQEYMTPMANLGVTREQARAIYEFLRSENQNQ